MITLSIIEYLISLILLPLIIVSIYYLYQIGFFHDIEEVKPFRFITLQANEGKEKKDNEKML